MRIHAATLCSGICAAEQAAVEEGLPIEWVLGSEIEAFPIAVATARHGYVDARRSLGEAPAMWGDFTTLRVRHFRRRRIAIPQLLVAGTPCQAFSVAGLRGGLADARGNLTLQLVRLCHALSHPRLGPVRLRNLVWENVPGILSSSDNAFGAFLAGLVGADAPLLPVERRWGPVGARFHPGSMDVDRTYGWQQIRWPREGMVEGPRARAAWRLFDAQHFGLAQRRARVFLVVDFGDGADPVEVLFERRGVHRDHASGAEARESHSGTLAGGARTNGGYSLDDMPMVSAALRARDSSRGVDSDATTGRGPPLVISPAVTSKWAKGTGGPAGDECQNLVPVEEPVAFDTTQMTSPGNYSAPQPGDPCHPLAAGDHPPAVAYRVTGNNGVYATGDRTDALTAAKDGSAQHLIHERPVAFSCKDSGQDATDDLSPTLRGMQEREGNANAGGQIAVAFTVSENSNGFAWESDKAAALQARTPGPADNTFSGVAYDPGLAFDLRNGSESTVAMALQAGGMGEERGLCPNALPHVQASSCVRRIMPIEAERLQGFPEVVTSAIFVSCEDEKSGRAPSAKDASARPNRERPGHADVDVLIDLERQRLRLRSRGRSLCDASIADGSGWSHPHIGSDAFVRLAVATMPTPGRQIPRGGEGSPANVTPSTPPPSGDACERWSRTEMEQLVADAARLKVTIATIFTTSHRGTSSLIDAEIRTTLSSCVATVIASFIPPTISTENFSSFRIEISGGYTNILFRGKPAADGPRYRALGNSKAVKNVRWILRRLVDAWPKEE